MLHGPQPDEKPFFPGGGPEGYSGGGGGAMTGPNALYVPDPTAPMPQPQPPVGIPAHFPPQPQAGPLPSKMPLQPFQPAPPYSEQPPIHHQPAPPYVCNYYF